MRAADRRRQRNARQRDIVMSAKGKLGRWLKLVAPVARRSHGDARVGEAATWLRRMSPSPGRPNEGSLPLGGTVRSAKGAPIIRSRHRPGCSAGRIWCRRARQRARRRLRLGAACALVRDTRLPRHRRRPRRRRGRAAAPASREIVVADIEHGPWPLTAAASTRWSSRTTCGARCCRRSSTASRRRRRADLRDLRAPATRRSASRRIPTSCCAPANCSRRRAALRVVAYEDGFESTPERFVQRIAARARCRRCRAGPRATRFVQEAGG